MYEFLTFVYPFLLEDYSESIFTRWDYGKDWTFPVSGQHQFINWIRSAARILNIVVVRNGNIVIT